MTSKFKKIIRFISIYGISRTIYKVLGRFRSVPNFIKVKNKPHLNKENVGIIGCGQFSFATISYFLNRDKKYHVSAVYDSEIQHSKSFANIHNVPHVSASVIDFFNQKLDLIYIASNHFSHAEYAIEAINRNIPVYVEKPLCVNWEQFHNLGQSIKDNVAEIYVGYNRPFSSAIRELVNITKDIDSPFTLNCFVNGHFIEQGHWYRDEQEGTRVCGNLGHWIDLTVHLLHQKKVNEYIDISITYSSLSTRDDDLIVTFNTDSGDLISLILTSRAEPFEGINETVNFVQGDVIVKIDDFRNATFWKGDKVHKRKYFPKDVGHGRAILQPLNKLHYKRDFDEVRQSTALMLQVKDMVIAGIKTTRFNLNDEKFSWEK
jgi:predicted dehydrogenase